MKKVMSLLLALMLLLSLCACGSETAEDTVPSSQPDPALQQFCTGIFYTPQDDCELEDMIEFYAGGTCSVPEYTWAISGDVLNLTVSLSDGAKEVYGFSIDTEEGIIKALFDDHVLYYKG